MRRPTRATAYAVPVVELLQDLGATWADWFNLDFAGTNVRHE